MRTAPALVLMFAAIAGSGCVESRDTAAAMAADICAPLQRPGAGERVDLGLLTLVPPTGARVEGAAPSAHCGVLLADADRRYEILNGHWGAGSFRAPGSREPSRPLCSAFVDGIEVQLFEGSDGDPAKGEVELAAVIGYPPKREGTVAMQSLLSSTLRSGDAAHVAQFRAVLWSIRRGNPDTFVRLPGTQDPVRFK